ncbi:sugar 3,4-ketoisomerase [Adhaeribacter aquaticus]|uniref:sugar 3,4-ketoisomerase n=1 Tax=Adhaeribacter aquaticus TaxID=299567 RepID=UPI00041CCF43|nr:FdtA/QdtA family cupin domain-containing protein [Adhaeribacter aquaticus]
MNSKQFSIFDCQVIHFSKIHNRAGNITPLQNNIDIPFEIKRIYYLYDIPGGESRGAHGHKNLEQLIIAASGSFDVTLDDGKNKKTVQLNRPYLGLHVLPGMWRDISNFSSGAICLVLASELYDINDYIKEYDEFKSYKEML